MKPWHAFVFAVVLAVPVSSQGAEPIKIVFIAGSNAFKPGEHEYRAGTTVLMDLVRQTPDVKPVLAIDWPETPEILAGARSVVMFSDGGDKHALIQKDRLATMTALSDAGVGLVQLHQLADYPLEFGDRARELTGGAWEKGKSQRAHWVSRFDHFPDHPIFRGVDPFTIDDGWLWGIHFVPGMKGVTPLLKTVSPKAAAGSDQSDDAIVAWAYERASGGRSFTFTGGHLHKSLAEEGYRRFLVNGILWSAHVDIPKTGAPVRLEPGQVEAALKVRPAR